MISRPKSSDTEAELLKMQDEYLRQKQEGKLQPAATTIRKSPAPKQSLFARQRNIKQSENGEKRLKTSDTIGELVGEVVERKHPGRGDPMEIDELEPTVEEDFGFPKPFSIGVRPLVGKQGKSIFSQIMDKQKSMETDEEASGGEAVGIHEENMQILGGMSESEIMEEREKLLNALSPKTVEFIRSRQKEKATKASQPSTSKASLFPVTFKPEDLPATMEFVKDAHKENWLHFDVLEPEKLAWTRDVEKKFPNLKPGEVYEARFDWNGLLQPFIDAICETEKKKDDRELYLHGEDPQRPGYTLQEFFRLGRSNVLQQRIAGINAIAGILNIFSQGYYDGVIDLPLTKIFFFLRFALDDNTPAVVEAASNALALMFYNESDEFLLDMMYDTKHDLQQPLMDNSKASIAGTLPDESENDLENALKNLSIDSGKKLFQSNVEDLSEGNEDERRSYSDFHLAEVNLMETLMRTNIIERIIYILTELKPSDKTIFACVKLLIRLGRYGKHFASAILIKDVLMKHLIEQYLQTSTNKSYYIVMKLYRILAGHDKVCCSFVKRMGVVERARCSLYNNDASMRDLRLQIESMRMLRLYLYIIVDEEVFRGLMDPIKIHLDLHLNRLEFLRDNHFILRQHASALMHLLARGNTVMTYPVFYETIETCCRKWFTYATNLNAEEFSQKILLAAVLEVASAFAVFNNELFFKFVNGPLIKFLKTPAFKDMARDLKTKSPLLGPGTDRCNVFRPLVNLGSVVRRCEKSPPTFIYTPKYSVHLMYSLYLFIITFDNATHVKNREYYQILSELYFNDHIDSYMFEFTKGFNKDVVTNWFLKTEIAWICLLLHSKSLQFNIWLMKGAFTMLNCLTNENYPKVVQIFRNFLFIQKFYTDDSDVSSDDIKAWSYLYNGVLVSRLGGVTQITDVQKKRGVIDKWNQILLNEGWPYAPLLILLNNAEVGEDRRDIIEVDIKPSKIVSSTLKYTLLLERNQFKCVSTTQRLMYLMLVYFDPELSFLDEPIKKIIREKMQAMKNFSFPPKFNVKLNKEKSFESLYKMFLDQFQSTGYGDDLFSALVMVPLAQRYDVKWRKIVWSEYAATLRYLNCAESDLLYNLQEYLNPLETDREMIALYANALEANSVMKDSIPWKIASRHVSEYRRRQVNRQETDEN